MLEMSGGRVFSPVAEALAPFGRIVAYGIAWREQNTVETGRLMRKSRAVVGFWLMHCLGRRDMMEEPLADLFERAVQRRPQAADGRDLPAVGGAPGPRGHAGQAHERQAAAGPGALGAPGPPRGARHPAPAPLADGSQVIRITRQPAASRSASRRRSRSKARARAVRGPAVRLDDQAAVAARRSRPRSPGPSTLTAGAGQTEAIAEGEHALLELASGCGCCPGVCSRAPGRAAGAAAAPARLQAVRSRRR